MTAPWVPSVTFIADEKVLAPAKVCAPEVTTPPKDAFAGCKFKMVPVKISPLPLGALPRGVNADILPAGPVGPCRPVSPVAPVAPVYPVAPDGPGSPIGPCAPVAPVAPVKPIGPCGP